jgi:hypothetical protein
MPARIKLSDVKALGFDFAEAVAEHRQALADWANRPADWDPCPAPGAIHPLVATAVTVGTYELVDDTPPPPAPPALEERKHELANAVRVAHAAANEVVLPLLKRPLIELRTRNAAALTWADRTLGDREALNNRKGIEARLAANEHHAAVQLAAIADLTDETIGAWTMAPFPESAPAGALALEDRKHELATEIDVELARQIRGVQHPLKRELLELKVRAARGKPEGERTAEDLAAIKEANELQQQVDLLQMHAAKLKATVADLDEAGLASWKPEPFPGS